MRIVALTSLALLVACSEPTTTLSKEKKSCDLDINALDGTSWVMLEAMPGNTTRENAQARLKWEMRDGKMKALYTVKSISDVYTYDCKLNEARKEWECFEPPKLKDWCQALEVNAENSCTPEKLREFGAADSTDQELADAIKAAKETVAKFRGQPTWPQFQLNNNNLGNKLQGILFAKVDAKQCNLSVSDMYMLIYNGVRKEDFNPVGRNAFVKTDKPYQWEHCEKSLDLLDWKEATLPDAKVLATIDPMDRKNERVYSVGETVHYHYMLEVGKKAEAGCTYSFDSYAQWEPVKQGQAVSPNDKGELTWTDSHTWSDIGPLEAISPAMPIGVYTMVRWKDCNGKKEKIDVQCRATKVMP
jgi:hypothetical protein